MAAALWLAYSLKNDVGEDEMAPIKWMGAALALIFSCSSNALASDPALTLAHLTGALYLVEDNHYTKTNSVVYVGPSSVTVIGATWTPDTAALLARQIKGVTDRPIWEVIDTSPDPEWSGGNAYWQRIGARVVAASVTCAFLKASWDTTVAGIQRFFPTYPSVPLSAPTDCRPDQFDLQDGRVKVLYLGPSHTDADVFVYFPDEKVLDAGSIIKEKLGNLAKANVQQYPNTLHKLQAQHLDIKTIIAGHWSAVHGPDLVETYLDLLAQNARGSNGRQ
jgi:metallo-beta-lactamase class B